MKTYSSIYQKELQQFIESALKEDIGPGDFSALAALDTQQEGAAQLIVKEDCVLAGVELAQLIFKQYDSSIELETFIEDGTKVSAGSIAFKVNGNTQSILATERLVLNVMQRMSGIATLTNQNQELISHTKCRVLDTRKTTPNFRIAEKWAVLIGGGVNHRMGLYDMIMLKDNHIDYCGGVSAAIEKTIDFLKLKQLDLPIIVETRDLKEVKACLDYPEIHRILLDNMSTEELREAIALIDGKIPTEASGNITKETIVPIAETGVDYISMGSITHSAPNIDLSLKAL
jgi:nicotinate-nucleotide pyrophosphorylase (carboxylating)